MSNIAIIGGGASGLFTAINISTNNKVTVFERYNECGKKILVTGNGKCNYWNDDQDLKHYHSNNNSFIELVNTLDNRDLVFKTFDRLGIVPYIKNGYYYPSSNQALSIRNALVLECKLLNIDIVNNFNVISIKKVNDKFIINDEYNFDKVVIACGSKAYYKDDNIGYEIAEGFGHNIVKVLPSLVQLVGYGNYFKDWEGVRSNTIVSLYVNDKLVKEETGEIMLTNYGISGICVFNLSGIANKALYNCDNVKVKINFLPNVNDVMKFLEDRSKIVLNRNISEFMDGVLNNKLVNTLLKVCNINKYSSYDDLSVEDKNKLVNVLSSFNVDIKESKSFDCSQVCSGGVDTKEVKETMESKIVPSLYFVGEILDVDGDCGGYNLGFAFLSSVACAKEINND